MLENSIKRDVRRRLTIEVLAPRALLAADVFLFDSSDIYSPVSCAEVSSDSPEYQNCVYEFEDEDSGLVPEGEGEGEAEKGPASSEEKTSTSSAVPPIESFSHEELEVFIDEIVGVLNSEEPGTPKLQYDVNKDGALSPLDVLTVVNMRNQEEATKVELELIMPEGDSADVAPGEEGTPAPMVRFSIPGFTADTGMEMEFRFTGPGAEDAPFLDASELLSPFGQGFVPVQKDSQFFEFRVKTSDGQWKVERFELPGFLKDANLNSLQEEARTLMSKAFEHFASHREDFPVLSQVVAFMDSTRVESEDSYSTSSDHVVFAAPLLMLAGGVISNGGSFDSGAAPESIRIQKKEKQAA